jgi:hypothetical protein
MDRSTLLPPRLAEILDDFALSDRQEKMELLLEFSASPYGTGRRLAEK